MSEFTSIIQEIHANIADNNTQSITAKKMRDTLIDLVNTTDSVVQDIDTNLTNLEDSVSSLEDKVDGLALGKFYGFFTSSSELPEGDDNGYAYVGESSPFSIWVFKDGEWSESGSVYGEDNGNIIDIDTDENGKLQFANRLLAEEGEYNYFLVRADKTLAQQISISDTIYEIRDSFDLGGSTLTIPSNCILRFNGGIIKNGKISGNRTTIQAPQEQISEGIRFTGTYTNEKCWLTWFGCKQGDNIDNSAYIENATNSTFSEIFVDGIYCISKPVDALTKKFIGNSVLNFNRVGFKANSDFSSITRNDLRDAPTEHTIYGMFYHYFDNHPEFKDLFIDGNKTAKYCIEQVAGYTNVDLYNITIQNALIAGVLQYGSERTIFDTVYIRNCQIGMYISSKKINEADFLDFSGASMGQPNLVMMKNVRTINNNYGWILYNNYNTSMYSCEGGYNYLVSLYAYYSTIYAPDFYSEGDGICDKYIDSYGNVISGTDSTLVPTSLINSNLDGFSSYTTAPFNNTSTTGTTTTVLYRAAMVFNGCLVEIPSMVSSNYPRGCRGAAEPFTSIVNPNNRTKAGVDCIILNYASRINIGTHKVFIGSTNNENSKEFLATYILAAVNTSTPYGIINTKFLTRGKTIYYGSYVSGGSSVFLDNDSNNTVVSHIDNTNFQDFSASTIFDFSAENLAEWYKGYPLYSLQDATASGSTHNNRTATLTSSDISTLFRGKRQVCIRFLVHVKQNYTAGNLGLVINPMNNSTIVGTSCNVLLSATNIKAGYYDFWVPTTLDFDTDFIPEWNKLNVSFRIPKDVANLNISQLYIYVPESGTYLWGSNFTQIPSSTTANRPASTNEGKVLYDSTLKKCILWNGSAWTNLDGTAL